MSYRLKPKQQKVCNLYIKGHSMRESLKLCGYSNSYADHMSLKFLKNKSVIEYIRQRQQDEADAQLADAVYTKKKLMELCDSPDSDVALAALKQLDAHNKWVKELNDKLDAVEKKLDSEIAPQNITFNVVNKDMNES